MESWKRLTQFLVRNATRRLYGFSFWKVLPLGPDSLANSWTKITALASKSQMLSFDNSIGLGEGKFNQSLDAVNSSVELSNNELLPATGGSVYKSPQASCSLEKLSKMNILKLCLKVPFSSLSQQSFKLLESIVKPKIALVLAIISLWYSRLRTSFVLTMMYYKRVY